MEVGSRARHGRGRQVLPPLTGAVDGEGVESFRGRYQYAVDQRLAPPAIPVDRGPIRDVEPGTHGATYSVELQHQVVSVRSEFDLGVALVVAHDEELDHFVFPEAVGGARWRRRWWVAEVPRFDLDAPMGARLDPETGHRFREKTTIPMVCDQDHDASGEGGARACHPGLGIGPTEVSLQPEILARSEDWVVVAKPSGVVVHRSEMGRERAPLLQQVRDMVGQWVHPVHRLDRGTSGCLLFALRREALPGLVEALRAGEKRYLALVRGHVRSREPVLVDRPVKSSRGVLQEARTRLVPVAGSVEPRASLVLAQPETGRFHQIRRHLRDLSHPVLGDSTHGDTRVNRAWREGWGLHRLALHCSALDLPLSEGRIRVVCPLPDDLGAVLRRMPWWDEACEALPDLLRPEAA